MRTRQDWDNIFGFADKGYIHTQMYESGKEMIYKMMAFGAKWQDARVLDLGCGNGRFAAALTEWPIKSYQGVDPVSPCIDFCKEAFKDYPHFTFNHVDFKNSMYNPKGVIDAKDYVFPFEDNSFDIAIVCSVFTHLQSTVEAMNYMKEIKRMLAPEGFAYLTWFRSPPNLVNFKEIEHTTFKECDIMNMLKDFEILYTESGHSNQWHDQWQMFAKKINMI